MNAHARAVFRSSWERRLGKTESPIEGDFLDNFCALAVQYGFEVARKSRDDEGKIIVIPQYDFAEKYRADFLIRYPFFGREFIAVVECDGHAFHERTKQQATHYRRRDRICQRLGYRLFRFTGSELRSDPSGCAYEVLDALMEFQTKSIVRAAEQANLEAA